MTFCTFCKKGGHSLNDCYKKPKIVKITRNYDQTQTYGRNGEVIIRLVTRQQNDKIDITSKNAETKISPNKQGSSNSKLITTIKNQDSDIEIIKEVKPHKGTKSKWITQTSKPNYKTIAFKQPDLQLMRVSEAKIACDMRNKAIMYINMNTKLQIETNKLIQNKKVLHQRIAEQNKKIDEMAEEIHHLSTMQGKKNKK